MHRVPIDVVGMKGMTLESNGHTHKMHHENMPI